MDHDAQQAYAGTTGGGGYTDWWRVVVVGCLGRSFAVAAIELPRRRCEARVRGRHSEVSAVKPSIGDALWIARLQPLC